MTDAELRAYALRLAIECEGPKAVTQEVLEAACMIYAFLTGADDAGAAASDAGRRPN